MFVTEAFAQSAGAGSKRIRFPATVYRNHRDHVLLADPPAAEKGQGPPGNGRGDAAGRHGHHGGRTGGKGASRS